MSKSFTLQLLLVLLIGGGVVQAQSVWPGDVNNNGVVNCMDVLYWGAAYGKSGAARSSTSTNWQAYAMPSAWAWSFERNWGGNGMNYAYADANGDGKIDRLDATNAIEKNFGKTHGTITSDKTSPIVNEGILEMILISNTQSANSGDRITLDLNLFGVSSISPDGSGIAFVVEYDPSLVQPNSFQFEKLNGLGLLDFNSYSLGKNNDQTGTFEVAATFFGGNAIFSRFGSGTFGRVSFQIGAFSGERKLKFVIKSIAYVNGDLKLYPMAVRSAEVTVVGNGGGEEPGPCPDVVDPVCGSDGKTYLNSCYAEKAGVSYTPGVCNTDCVDPTRINPNAVCPEVYQPVCGCNGETYSNSCEAEAAGVRAYTTGPCKNNDQCYDPNYVITAAYTEVANNGVIVFTTPNTNDPVCGCNGVSYKNSYVAEANGITFYTKGKCSTACVDPAKMNPNAVCTQEYAPVCGCNGVTYANECIAKAAGVVSYTPGVCGSPTVPAWCSKATPLDCGNFLPGETTSNAGNNISNYPCSGKNYGGPERVYIINKTTAGDLQIGLEILSANLDLDLFLLKADCNQITCLKSSTTSNTQTNNEGIVLDDAPTGTYYLVVDGPAAGQYNLEFSCGYLYCGDATPLTCGVNYNGNNSDGHDNVSLYSCSGGVLNVENNGPEKVHYFTLTQEGEVSISMTNLSANLELFLLKDCELGSCLSFSQNAGTNSESINATLPAGTYYVVVEGYNGATSNYRLRVDCATASCNLNATLTPINSSCGQNNGAFTVQTTGGNPTYIITWTGPVSGTKNTQNNNNTISNLPAGTYTVVVTDRYGCQVEKKVTIGSAGDISFQTNITNATCGQAGNVKITVSNATAPLKVFLSGAANNAYEVSGTAFTLNGMQPGLYHIYIVDANGCSASKDVTISQEEGNFSFTATPNAAACENPGSITIRTSNGSAPHKVYVTGPKNGSVEVNGNNFTIQQLPGGTYTIKIVTATGCSYTTTVTVPTTELVASISTINGNCQQPNAIKVSVSTGKPNFIIDWDGPGNNDGSVTTSGTTYTIPNLPAGSYTVTITDGNWCSITKVVTLTGGTGGFALELIPDHGICESPGAIGVDINGGKAPYKINWDGPGSNDGNTNINTTSYSINTLPAGTYKVTVTDANGCSVEKTTTLQAPQNNLVLKLTANAGNCGQPGSILVDVDGGIPNYKITWQSQQGSGSADSNSDKYEIKNLLPGTYPIKITDGNGCSVSKTIEVPAGASSFTMDLIPTRGICQTPGSIGVSINGGKAPYQVTWNGPGSNDGNTTVSDTWLDIANLASGDYSITVKDANGCVVTKNMALQTPEGSIALNLAVTEGNCGQSGSILVDVDGGTPIYKITWQSQQSSGSADSNNDKYEIKNLIPGTYTIQVSDKNGCSISKTIVVTGGTPGFDLTLSSTNSICETPGAVKITIAGGKAPFKITWNGPGTNDGTATSNASTYDIGNLPTGSYTVTVKDANNCENSKTIQVSKIENSMSLKLTGTDGACGQPNKILVDVDGGMAAYVILWDGPVDGEANSNSDKYEIKDLPAGTYTIKVYDKNWCAISNSITVTGGASNFNLELIPTSGICSTPGSIGVSITGGKAPYQVTWDGPGNNDGNTTINDTWLDVASLASGAYSITVKDANNCTVTKTTQVSVTENTVNFVSTIKDATCLQSGSILVDVNGGTAVYNITWDGPGSNDGSTSINTDKFEIKNLIPGSYVIKIVDKNGCSFSKTVSVGGNTTGVDIALTPQNGICETPGSIKVKINSGQAPFKITWEGPGSNDGSAISNTNTYDIPNLPGGSYTVTVKDANECPMSKTTQVATPEGNLQISVSAINGACGQKGSIKVNVSGGSPNYIIEWDGQDDGSTTTGSNNYTIANLAAGSYTIKVTDGNWCTTSKVISVSTAPAALFTATPTHGICDAPGSIKLNLTSGTAPFSISWTGNNTPVMTTGSSYVINNLPAGSYTVNVTDSQGCKDVKNVTINASQAQLMVMATLIEGSCGAPSKVRVNIVGGTAKYNIAWEGPQNSSVQVNSTTYELTALPAGNYKIIVTDANGCDVSTNIQVYHSTGELFKTKPFNGVCESPGSIRISLIGGMPVYNVSWTGPTPGAGSTSDTAFVLQNLESGTYTIKVTDKKGCTETKTVTLGQNQTSIDFYAAKILNECGQSNSISIKVNTGFPTYTINWNGPGSQDGSGTTNESNFQIPNLLPGTYTLTVFDKNWCYADTIISIQEQLIDVFAAAVTNGVCGGKGSIKLNLSGTAPYTVKWQGPGSNTTTVNNASYTISDLSAGTYIVTVTDAKGCSEIDTIVVQSANDLTAEILGTNGNCDTEGKIEVNILTGQGPFFVIYAKAGIVDTVTVRDTGALVIADIEAGNYTVTIKGAGTCAVTKDVTISITESVLDLNATPTNASCGATGKIHLKYSGGEIPYTITWVGQGISKSTITAKDTFTIADLPDGTYMVTVKDKLSCTIAKEVKVLSTESNLEVVATVTNGACGQMGQVLVSATGGTAPFTYKWSGASSGTQTSNNPSYNINSLSSGTYNITVTDGSGCSKTRMVSVTNNNQTPVANFSFAINGMNVTFTNQSSPGSYQWNFDDQSNSTQNNPTHTYLATGTFEVCLTVSNSCGSKEICKQVTIGTPEGAVNIDVEDGAGGSGELVYIPVVIENCVTSTLVSFAGSLQIENTNVAVITGILPGSISPQYSATNKTFSYYANNGSGVPCGAGQILFYVIVELRGNSGASTVLRIVNTPLAIEVGGMSNGVPTSIPHLVTAGTVTVQSIALLQGEITTYWGDALPTVEVSIVSDTLSKKDTTDLNGHYTIPALPLGKRYMIQPTLDGDPANGLSTYALFAGQRFILGMNPAEITSPYQIIAGDANCDGRFTSLDLFIIQRLIIGTSTDFGSCPPWVFVKAGQEMPDEFTATNVFPYHSCDTMMLMRDTTSDFIGVKVGDILGHANPQLLSIEPRSKDILRFIAINRAYRAGEVVEIVLTSENFREIASYQMGLSFDFNQLQFLELTSDTQSPFARIALNGTQAKDGVLRMSWFDPSGKGISTQGTDPLLTLRFVALKDIENLANLLEVNSRYMRSEAYTTQVKKMDIALQFVQTTLEPNEQVTSGYKLYQNTPNPFNQQTIIGFDLPQDMQADLIIFDQLGKAVKTFSGSYNRGYNRVEFPRAHLSAGVYYYTLRTANFAQTKSMIIFE